MSKDSRPATAEAIGMHFDKEYPDEANEITHVSVIYRESLLNWKFEIHLMAQKIPQAEFFNKEHDIQMSCLVC